MLQVERARHYHCAYYHQSIITLSVWGHAGIYVYIGMCSYMLDMMPGSRHITSREAHHIRHYAEQQQQVLKAVLHERCHEGMLLHMSQQLQTLT